MFIADDACVGMGLFAVIEACIKQHGGKDVLDAVLEVGRHVSVAAAEAHGLYGLPSGNFVFPLVWGFEEVSDFVREANGAIDV